MSSRVLPLWLPFALLASLSASAPCQDRPSPPTAGPSAELSPKAAYDDALHPLEVTRQNIGNWSDVEIAAMNVAIARGKAACVSRSPAGYTGAALIDLARLCSLGQVWPTVVDAASRYLAEPATPKPLLTDAYVAKIHAELQLKAEHAALTDSETMLKSVPYTPLVAESLDETLGYMHFLLTADALSLSAIRQTLILEALAEAAHPALPLPSPPNPDTATATPPSPPSAPAIASDLIPVHQLYAEGLAFAALQQLAAQPLAASKTLTALDAALPPALPPDDALPIAEARRRYDILGHPLTGIVPVANLRAPDAARPIIPANLTITALLLFPDWCAQCVRMGSQFPETVFSVEGHSAYLFGLLAETVPPRKPDPTVPNLPFNPAYAASLLAGTSNLTVSPDLLDRFGGSEYPLLLLTDANGILRLIQPVTGDDLRPGGDIDSAIALVGKTFPATPPGPKSPPPGTRSPTHPPR